MHTFEKLFIGGEWVDPAGSDTIDVISPHSEELVGRVPEGTEADIDKAVAAARDSFDNGSWSRMQPSERAAIVQDFANVYAAQMMDMAAVITEEMGSPISFSQLAQSPAPWMMLTAFLQVAAEYPWEERRAGVLGGDVIVRREGVGVVGAIVPWNVPQFVTMSKLAPALLAGCSIVIKPSPETPLDAFLMAKILEEAGVPKGVVSIVPAGREVGEHLVRHPGVDKIAFTGSTAAGRKIASICGEQLKRYSLELGGKSAAIILDDADLGSTMEGLKFASLMNNGQACVAQTRILASKRRYAEVVDALGSMVGSLVVGDPSDPATEVGPLVAERQQERVEKYIALGQEEGAKVVVGGSGRPPGLDKGWYVQPTVFADVSNDMRIAQEEIFGPVLAVIPYDGVDDAVRIANDSDYGLAGSVWTADVDLGLDIARRVRTGTYGINQYTMDFIAPFGGFKGSGVGREFGREGLEHYLELKSIVPPAGY
ncbi:MAG TPA: aldehyde dehydrogenase [Acidimicrobiales bacterium]|jgi:betaine-aldehyde dehydrogenase|nr:aldehyde dehydrogenase [Acidimicrobiales bacterium]